MFPTLSEPIAGRPGTTYRLPVIALEAFLLNGTSMFAGVVSQLKGNCYNQSLNAGASQILVPAIAGKYFVINMIHLIASTATEVQILNGASILFDYLTVAFSAVGLNFQPNGLWAQNINTAISVKNNGGAASAITCHIYGDYI